MLTGSMGCYTERATYGPCWPPQLPTGKILSIDLISNELTCNPWYAGGPSGFQLSRCLAATLW